MRLVGQDAKSIPRFPCSVGLDTRTQAAAESPADLGRMMAMRSGTGARPDIEQAVGPQVEPHSNALIGGLSGKAG